MVVGGVSYSQKLQKRSLPSAPNGQRVASSGEQLLALQADSQFTPREGHNDLQASSFKRKNVNTNQPKKELRVSQRGPITATKNNTPSIPQVISESSRNNILSSSLQILNVAQAPTGRIEQRNASVVVNANPRFNNTKKNLRPSQPESQGKNSKGLHLRYVSQGMQRSNSIEEGAITGNDPPKYLNSRTSVPSASRRINVTATAQRESELQQQVYNSPPQTITERVQTQQIQEKKALSSTMNSQNQRRVGVSSNNVIGATNVLTSAQTINNHATSDMQMQRSLHVQSNQSSIVIDALNSKKVKQPTKFAQSVYGGVMSSKLDHGAQESSFRDRKIPGVPLIVNSRKNISDCLLIGTDASSSKTTSIIKGVRGLGASAVVASGTPNGKMTTNIKSSFKQMPSVNSRKDRVQSNKKKTTSNQSFQSINQESHLTQQMNLDNALKTAQMGFTQRTRQSVIDANKSNLFDSVGADLIKSRDNTQQNMSVKTHEQLVLLHNVTPGQGRKPDFRQSTALPNSYKKFVATVNSQQSQLDPKILVQEVIQSSSRQNNSQKRGKKQKKDDILKMINKLEMGENSETFRNLAKKFYKQNIYTKQPQSKTNHNRNSRKSPINSCESATESNHVSDNLPTQQSDNMEEGCVKLLQKQLWQQFQLLRILKQTKYQQHLEKNQRKGENGILAQGPPGSQSLEYGFEMTEEEMYKLLFLKQDSHRKVEKPSSAKPNDDKQPYASFDCPECVQMASLMLEEELKFYQQRHFGKRKGKSRDATTRAGSGLIYPIGLKSVGGGHHPLKGIAGLQTQGVSLKNQRLTEDEQLMLLRELQDSAQGKKSKRGQTQQYLVGKRMQTTANFDDPRIIGQMLISRGSLPPQVVQQKKINNPGFRQVIRGEQMTHYTKAQAQFCPPPMNQQQLQTGSIVCTCRQGPYQPNARNVRGCICGASNNLLAQAQPALKSQQQYQAPAIPSMNYGGPPVNQQSLANRRSKKGQQASHGKVHGHSGQDGHQHAHYGQGQEAKNALDGTVAGHKRKFKPANGIYQPPLQPFKHLAQSPINQVINKVNELVLILFKQRIKSSDQQIIKLFKYFSIPIPRGNGVVLDTKAIRMPDFQQTVNQKLLIKLYKVLNHENGGIQPEQSTQIFRFFVGKGNNYQGIRQIISRRTWWNRCNQKQEKFYGQRPQGGQDDDFIPNCANAISSSLDEQQLMSSSKQFQSGCHFIWTQWRKTEHHEFLKRVDEDRAKAKRGAGRNNNTFKTRQSPRQLLTAQKSENAPLANLPTLIYNRLDDNYHLSNKKALFLNISTYYRAMGINPFEVAIPLTFNVKTSNNSDPEYIKFTRAYKQYEQQKDANIWIIKPGENSNRGTGIQVASGLGEIQNIIKQLSSLNGNRTSIVQKYLDKPLLIHNRKFDIRGYALITSVNGKLKGYMYRDCYFRTSSKQFDLTNLHSRYVHLTNDAIQINSEDYGKYESGNKLSINDFQRYLDQNHGSKNVCFMRDLFPQMERLATDSFRAVGSRIDPSRLSNCYEIFGYDFMIDENFKVFLIEANTNPCLEICSPLLARIVPELLDNSFRIAIDPLYQPAQLLAKIKDETDGMRENQASASTVRERLLSSCPDVKGAAAECDMAAVQQSSPVVTKRFKEAASIGAAAQPAVLNQGALKRQRLEMLTQIKYTLIYDERIDKPVVDKILAEYEQKLINSAKATSPVNQQQKSSALGDDEAVAADETASPVQAQPQVASALFREIVEEEKLDELQAKKEEIEAAEDEEAGILPQPLMLQPLAQQPASEDEEEDDCESEEDIIS